MKPRRRELFKTYVDIRQHCKGGVRGGAHVAIVFPTPYLVLNRVVYLLSAYHRKWHALLVDMAYSTLSCTPLVYICACIVKRWRKRAHVLGRLILCMKPSAILRASRPLLAQARGAHTRDVRSICAPRPARTAERNASLRHILATVGLLMASWCESSTRRARSSGGACRIYMPGAPSRPSIN